MTKQRQTEKKVRRTVGTLCFLSGGLVDCDTVLSIYLIYKLVIIFS